MSGQYDKKVLQCFLKEQLKLFPEAVAETEEEADEFLDMMMATVVKGPKQVLQYFDEVGADIAGMNENTILEEAEVFDIGDGRYLIVEG